MIKNEINIFKLNKLKKILEDYRKAADLIVQNNLDGVIISTIYLKTYRETINTIDEVISDIKKNK